MGLEEVHSYLGKELRGQGGFFLGRPGGTESEGMAHFLRERLPLKLLGSKKSYSSFFLSNAARYSGISWSSISDLDHFSYRYLSAALDADCFGYGEFAPGALGIAEMRARLGMPIVRSTLFDPWLAVRNGLEPWTKALAGMKILVVHPFTKSIKHQFERSERVNGLRLVLPIFDLEVIRPPVTLSKGASTWIEEFRLIESEILARDFDVALIGAGSYGLPLAQSVARSGKKAIHTAGITQLIFGVIGKRWERSALVDEFVDDSWIRPFQEDVAPGTEAIEGGSYT